MSLCTATLHTLVTTNTESNAVSVDIWGILGGGMALMIITISVLVFTLYVIK